MTEEPEHIKEARRREIVELDEDIQHIDKEFRTLARAKTRTMKELKEYLQSMTEDEILELDKVESVEFSVEHNPENIVGKTITVQLTHGYEGEMQHAKWNKIRKELRNSVEEKVKEPFDSNDTAFDLYVRIPFGEVSFAD